MLYSTSISICYLFSSPEHKKAQDEANAQKLTLTNTQEKLVQGIFTDAIFTLPFNFV